MRGTAIIDRQISPETAGMGGKGVFIARAKAMLLGNGERIDAGLELDDKPTQGRDCGRDDAQVHHRSGAW